MLAKARAVDGSSAKFRHFEVERREPGPHDVAVSIHYCGICHSDMHHVKNDYGRTRYPLVPGHEIAGVVEAIGDKVTKFQVGDRVGVGCMVDSCAVCDNCLAGREQMCREGDIKTAAGLDRDGNTTQGGYSNLIVVDERFVLAIPDSLSLERAAPLLCAGVTMYSPLRRFGVGPGTRVGVLGLGGLGHLAVQLTRAFGAQPIVLEIGEDKRADALRLGASSFNLVSEPSTFEELRDGLDVLICTVPVNLDMDAYLSLLDSRGVFVLVGVPAKPFVINAGSLIKNSRSIAGTLIGGVQETQEMLEFCSDNGIGAEVEIIDPDSIDVAYERVDAGDVKFRFVIDCSLM